MDEPKVYICKDREHNYQWSQKKEATGPNILGKEVTCWGRDVKCSTCSSMTWQLDEPDKKYAR